MQQGSPCLDDIDRVILEMQSRIIRRSSVMWWTWYFVPKICIWKRHVRQCQIKLFVRNILNSDLRPRPSKRVVAAAMTRSTNVSHRKSCVSGHVCRARNTSDRHLHWITRTLATDTCLHVGKQKMQTGHNVRVYVRLSKFMVRIVGIPYAVGSNAVSSQRRF